MWKVVGDSHDDLNKDNVKSLLMKQKKSKFTSTKSLTWKKFCRSPIKSFKLLIEKWAKFLKNDLIFGSARCEALKPFSLRKSMTIIVNSFLEATNNLHQKVFRRRLIEFVAKTERDGWESDVAIQVISVDSYNCGVRQVPTPEDCRIEARKRHESDDCETPKSSEKSLCKSNRN